jgi:hypothetical protein
MCEEGDAVEADVVDIIVVIGRTVALQTGVIQLAVNTASQVSAARTAQPPLHEVSISAVRTSWRGMTLSIALGAVGVYIRAVV